MDDELDDDGDHVPDGAPAGDDDLDGEVRAALRALRAGEATSFEDVLTLVTASPSYAVRLVPQAALDAIHAASAIGRDLANGGLDQVAWNHGAEATHAYAAAFQAVGAIENAEVLDRLARGVTAYHAEHGDVIKDDPVRHFLAYRKAHGGPFFPIPAPEDELPEAVLEFVIEGAAALPDPDGELPRAPAQEIFVLGSASASLA